MVLKLFSPFGKITKLDFMFHWSGPKKGTPRGYCFLEFEASSQAIEAVKTMNRK
ncbi:putative RNA-binding protein 18, partial [Gryganskiella cystojenkinii]